MLISLVSPVYNEGKAIEEFVRRSASTLAIISENYEIVLVNDCSTDNTKNILEGLKSEIPQLRVVNLYRNSGQHAASVVGLRSSRGEFVFLMDSDLQVSPEDMKRLYNLGQRHDKWDIISGSRTKRSDSIVRSIGSVIVSRIINALTGTKLKDPGSTFMLMTRNTVEQICEQDVLAQNLQILMGFLGLKILDIEVDYHDRKSRKSSYHFIDLVELLVMALLNFTTGRATLMVLLAVGCLMFPMGGCGVLFLIIRGMVEQTALPTNYLLFFSFILLVGLQFIFLGIIAYKLERINKNLAFRKILHREVED
jgi:undecaprenyl-phosphate 4-deoxy-4-formamido-L-arabinose transferase